MIKEEVLMKHNYLIKLGLIFLLSLSLMAACSKKETVEEATPEVATEEEGATEATTEPTTETTEPVAEVEVELSTDPLEMITEGYYTYSYPVEGIGDMTYYFHFYEEQPVIGAVFYAGFALNQINFAGTYKVEEKEMEYSCYPDREKQLNNELTTGTAPYTITFFDWEGNVLDECAYDGEFLYNDMEVITGVGTGQSIYAHDTDGENSSYVDTYAAEVGQIYLSYVAAQDAASTVALYHNGTYLDMVNMMIEGTWSMEESGDSYTYALTPHMEIDTPATLVVPTDKATATYTPKDGDAVEMLNAESAGPKVVMTLKGEAPIPGQEVNAELLGNLYEDGSCDLVASAFGQAMPIDQGTYAVAEDGYTITFTFDMAGEIVTSLGEQGVALQYLQNETVIGNLDTQLIVSLAE